MAKLNTNATAAVKADKKAGELKLNKHKDEPKTACCPSDDYEEKRYISISQAENGYKIHTNSKEYVALDAEDAGAAVVELLSA